MVKMKPYALLFLFTIVASVYAQNQGTCRASCKVDDPYACNGRGTCVDNLCVCYTPYSNLVDSDNNCKPCATCAEGYQQVTGSDGSVECVKKDINPCEKHNCGENALACRALNDEAFECICDKGYTGPTCDDCATGYIRDRTSGKCILDSTNDPCANNPCGENSVCSFTDVVRCSCKEGFIPTQSGCKPKPTTCKDIDCGKGECVEGAAGPVCKCNEGYRHLVETGTTSIGVIFEDIKYCAVCDTDNGYYLDKEKCKKREDPCDNIVCENDGKCVVDYSDPTKPVASCKCPFRFTGPKCEKCAEGYVDTRHDGFTGRCVGCDAGYRPEGVFCVPEDKKCTDCGDNGNCTAITVNGVTRYTCICNDGWTHDPTTGKPCSVCKDPLADPAKKCAPPTDFDACTQRCRKQDPNSICIVDTLVIDGKETVSYRCGCDPKYKPDRTGKCFLCSEGYYANTYDTNANVPVCEKPRCPGGCNRGYCAPADTVTPTGLPVFKCYCPDGWTGDNCDKPVDPETNPSNSTCSRCVGNQICIKVTSRDVLEYNAEPAAAEDRVYWECRCPRNFQDYVDPITGAIKPCAVCVKGFTGPNCDIPVVDDNLCANIGCPRGTVCRVFENSIDFKPSVHCVCPDGSIWSDKNRCDLPPVTDPCDNIKCPENSICVPSENSKLGAQCVCNKGFQLVTDASGRKVCSRIPPACPVDCPEDQVCVDLPDFSTPTFAYKPRCECRSPNAYLENGRCVCKKGWSGLYCHIPEDVCKIYGEKCPPGTRCVSDKDGTFKCVCADSRTGLDCAVDLCANVKCDASKGLVCNSEGKCECPISMKLVDGVCKPRDTPNKPIDVIRPICLPGDICYKRPTQREFDVKDNTTEHIQIDSEAVTNESDMIDLFQVEAAAKDKLKICVRRFLGLRKPNKDEIALALKYCIRLIAIEIVEVPEDKEIDQDGTTVTVLEIGSEDKVHNGTVVISSDAKEDDKGKRIDFKLSTLDGIVDVICYLVSKPRAIDTVNAQTDAVKCALVFRVPPVFYTSPKNKVCFKAQVEIEDGSNADVRVNTDGDLIFVNFFPATADGARLDSMGTLTLDTNAIIGSKKQPIKYTTSTEGGSLIVRGCVLSPNPDGVYIDPEMSVSDSDFVLPGAPVESPSAASALTVFTFLVMVVSLLVALF